MPLSSFFIAASCCFSSLRIISRWLIRRSFQVEPLTAVADAPPKYKDKTDKEE